MATDNGIRAGPLPIDAGLTAIRRGGRVGGTSRNDRFYRRSHLSSTWINIDDAAAKVMLRALRARIGARR